MYWCKGRNFMFLINPASQLVLPLHGQLPFYYLPGAKGCNFVFLLNGHLTTIFFI